MSAEPDPTSGDIVENVPPQSDVPVFAVRYLEDDSLPAGDGLVPQHTRKFDPKEHKARTRKMLALSALGVLAFFHVGLVTLLACNVIQLDELIGIIAASSGLQALTAVAFAFYFAKS